MARPRPGLEGGTRLGAETHRSAGTGCRQGRPPRGPLRGSPRGLPRGRAPARREGGHRAGNHSARTIAITAARHLVDRRRAVGGGRPYRLARRRHGAPRSGGVPGRDGRHARERHAAAQGRGAGGRDRSRRRRPDRRNRRPGPVGGRMRPRRLVRRGAQAAGSRPAVFRAQRRLPARLFRARRGRPHRLDRGRRPDRRGADHRGRGRHADRDPRRARDRAPDDPRLRPRRAGARRLDPAHRRGGHRARLLPRPLVRRGPARAHTRPAEGGPGADPDATPRALPRRRPSACEVRQPGWAPAPLRPGTLSRTSAAPVNGAAAARSPSTPGTALRRPARPWGRMFPPAAAPARAPGPAGQGRATSP